jgi:RNA polymerase sigma-70 factor (ECF subfamily)
MPSLEGWDLKRYRAYLKVRARTLELDPRLKIRFDESDWVQEVFLQAQAATEPCRGNSHQVRLAYLDRIFENLFTDFLRKHHAQKRDIDREEGVQQALNESSAAYRLDPSDSGASPSEQAARREEFLLAMAAVEQLPENERDVIILTYLQGLSVQEAADRLGLSRGQAAGLYTRGTTRLRDLLNPGSGE